MENTIFLRPLNNDFQDLICIHFNDFVLCLMFMLQDFTGTGEFVRKGKPNCKRRFLLFIRCWTGAVELWINTKWRFVIVKRALCNFTRTFPSRNVFQEKKSTYKNWWRFQQHVPYFSSYCQVWPRGLWWSGKVETFAARVSPVSVVSAATASIAKPQSIEWVDETYATTTEINAGHFEVPQKFTVSQIRSREVRLFESIIKPKFFWPFTFQARVWKQFWIFESTRESYSQTRPISWSAQHCQYFRWQRQLQKQHFISHAVAAKAPRNHEHEHY